MKTNSLSQKHRLAGAAAALIGLLNVVLVIYVVVTPAAQRYSAEESFRYFAESPLALSLAWIVFVIMAVFSYAVVPAVDDLLQHIPSQWKRPATLYGIVGYTVLGVWAITLTRTMPELAHNFVTGDAMTRTAILAVGVPEMDPDGWFMFGGPGTWLLVINLLALRHRILPRWQAITGIVLGLGHWATVFASLFSFEPLNLLAAGLGAVLAPVWFIALGVRLWRRTPQYLPSNLERG